MKIIAEKTGWLSFAVLQDLLISLDQHGSQVVTRMA